MNDKLAKNKALTNANANQSLLRRTWNLDCERKSMANESEEQALLRK